MNVRPPHALVLALCVGIASADRSAPDAGTGSRREPSHSRWVRRSRTAIAGSRCSSPPARARAGGGAACASPRSTAACSRLGSARPSARSSRSPRRRARRATACASPFPSVASAARRSTSPRCSSSRPVARRRRARSCRWSSRSSSRAVPNTASTSGRGSAARASTSSCAPTAGARSERAAGSAGSPTGCAARMQRPLVAGRVRRAPRGPRRDRARRRPGGPEVAARPLPRVRSLPPARGLRPERRARRRRRVARRALARHPALARASSARLPASRPTSSPSGRSRRSIRAGIVGALGSVAWLAARQRDRWHFLLLAALVLLAWNPYTLLDPGSSSRSSPSRRSSPSCRSLAACFRGLPGSRAARARRSPSPRSAASATAPILWLQFHAVPLLAVPANALAAPAMAPLLALALTAAVVDPVSPGLAAALAGLAGWCAAWLALCARIVGGLPFAQVSSAAEPSRWPRSRSSSPPMLWPAHGGDGRLKPVYLISGSDRPKIRVALERLRNRFEEGAVEVLAARRGTRRRRRCGLQRARPLRRRAAARDRRGRRRLEGARREGRRRVPQEPAPETVLALVGVRAEEGLGAGEGVRESPARCSLYDAPRKRDLPAWVAKQFEQHGVRAPIATRAGCWSRWSARTRSSCGARSRSSPRGRAKSR